LGVFEKRHFVTNTQAIDVTANLNKYFKDNGNRIAPHDLKKLESELITRVVPCYLRPRIIKYSTPESMKKNDYVIDMGKRYNRQLELAYLTAFSAIFSILWAIYSLYCFNGSAN